jgi:hypothetical protein
MVNTTSFAAFQNFKPWGDRRLHGIPIKNMRVRVKHQTIEKGCVNINITNYNDDLFCLTGDV